MVFSDLFQLIAGNIWLYGGAFALVLSLLVFVHEWGHYIIARLCGVKVEVFSIGFGKELFGYTDKKGTRWKFSLIPLGGYVKMFGDVDPASARHDESVTDEVTDEVRPLTADERKVAFYSQSVWKRAAIVFAGPAINFIFAIILLTSLYVTIGSPVTPPVGAAVISDSAAERAGFMPHDEILAIDGREIDRFEHIRRDVMVGLDRDRVFTVRRGNDVVEITARPDKVEETDRFGFSHSRGALGLISPGNGIELSRINTVDGIPVESAEQARRLLVERMGDVFAISVNGGGAISGMIIQPLAEQNELLFDPEQIVGAFVTVESRPENVFVTYGPVEAVGEAVRETWDITASTMVALGQMVTGVRSATELGGIIRIGAVAGDMARAGLIALVTFTALLSINLGLINLFPIPMLDGGHLVFYAVEAVKGSPISEPVQEYAFRFGLAILVGIMLFANLNDIVQLIL